MLKERDIVMLTQFFIVLNYFWAVYFIIWIRKTSGVPSRQNPSSETALHVFLYLVYILEIFDPPLTTNVYITIYAVFTPIVFLYHVSVCRRFVEAMDDADTCLLPPKSKGQCVSKNRYATILVFFIWILCASAGVLAVTIISWTLHIPISEVLTMYHIWPLPDYFINVLKVSFISLAIEAYLHVAFRNVPPNGKQSVQIDFKQYKTIFVPRFVISVVLFLGLVFLAAYPNSLRIVMVTDDIPRKVVDTTTIIFLQMVFILDSVVYVATYYVRRFLASTTTSTTNTNRLLEKVGKELTF